MIDLDLDLDLDLSNINFIVKVRPVDVVIIRKNPEFWRPSTSTFIKKPSSQPACSRFTPVCVDIYIYLDLDLDPCSPRSFLLTGHLTTARQ